MLICRLFCTEGFDGYSYLCLLLVWLVISLHPSPHEKESQSTAISTRSSLDSCRLFSRCLTFTSPPACPTSVVLLLLCLIPFFLGLVGVSPLKDAWGRLQIFCLTGSWEAVLKLTVSWALNLSGLNYCGVWELWGESVEKTGSSRKAKTDS